MTWALAFVWWCGLTLVMAHVVGSRFAWRRPDADLIGGTFVGCVFLSLVVVVVFR